jgi:hypothetical protein
MHRDYRLYLEDIIEATVVQNKLPVLTEQVQRILDKSK